MNRRNNVCLNVCGWTEVRMLHASLDGAFRSLSIAQSQQSHSVSQSVCLSVCCVALHTTLLRERKYERKSFHSIHKEKAAAFILALAKAERTNLLSEG